MSRLLIISPHLDDAILSCGARIAWEKAQGNEIRVATCFTASPMTALYRQRMNDDIQALGLLGAQPIHLGFTDAPFRDSQYHNFSTILFHHKSPENTQPLVESIRTAIQNLAISWKPDEIIFPLGTGGHIDHQLVWQTSHYFWNADCMTGYYEDLPYALIPGWSAARWHALGATATQPSSITQPRIIPELADAPYPFVKNYTDPGSDAANSAAKYRQEFTGLTPIHHQTRQWTLEGHDFILEPTIVDDAYFNKKTEAIACYSTEWPALFGKDKSGIANQLRSSQPFDGQTYFESTWMLKTTR